MYSTAWNGVKPNVPNCTHCCAGGKQAIRKLKRPGATEVGDGPMQ